MSGGTARVLAPIAVGYDAVEHAAVFGGAVVGVFTRDIELAVGVDLAAFMRLIKCHMARFGLEGHGHQARPLKTILVGWRGAAVHPGFGDGLRAARPADIAREPTIFEGKELMPAPNLLGERGREAPKAVRGKRFGLAQQRHGMAERLARITEAPS